MKCILMICDFLNESLAYQENLLAKYYEKQGHRVVVVTSTTEDVFEFIRNESDPRRPAKVTNSGALRVYRQPYSWNFLHRIRKFAGVDAILARERPDVILVHDIQFNFDAVRRYKREHPQTRVVMDYHADYSNSGRNMASRLILHRLLRRPVLRRALPLLDAIYPVTPASQVFLREVYGVPEARMTLLPLGCDMDASRAVLASDARQRLRAHYGVPADAVVFFTGGKLTPRKQVARLIGAFMTLQHGGSWLFIGGDAAPEDRQHLEQLKAQAAGHPHIVFTGWLEQNELLEHLHMADVAVYPASQSVVWQQSIGMGKPLIIGEPLAVAGGDQDVTYLNRHDNVLLAPDAAGDASRLAAALAALAADERRRAAMTEGALRTARELLDWDEIARETLGQAA